MNSANKDAHRPIRIINLTFSLLTLLLVIFISVFSWQSWHKEKAELIRNLKNIMELGEKAVDSYFTQLEYSMYDEAQVMADKHTEQPDAFLGKPYRSKDLSETISSVLANDEKKI
jgi:hypothetical protein